jgi:hypothetical protein
VGLSSDAGGNLQAEPTRTSIAHSVASPRPTDIAGFFFASPSDPLSSSLNASQRFCTELDELLLHLVRSRSAFSFRCRLLGTRLSLSAAAPRSTAQPSCEMKGGT